MQAYNKTILLLNTNKVNENAILGDFKAIRKSRIKQKFIKTNLYKKLKFLFKKNNYCIF